MHFDTIQLFCDVAEHRSVSRAAELNGISQSAASQRLKALETELGIELIDRSTRPLELTPAGNQYLRGCRQILDQYRRLRQQITTGSDQLRGTVKIAAIYSAGIDLLHQVEAAFAETQPGVTIQVEYIHPHDVYERVKAGRCDLGILSYPDQWSGLAHDAMREEPMVVVTRADHGLTGRGPLTPSDLAGVEMVAFDSALPIARRITAYLRSHRVSPKVVQAFDNIDTIKGFLAETDAAAILPDRTVRREVQRGALATSVLTPPLTRPMAAVYSRARPLTTAAKAFRDFLIEHQPSEASAPSTAAAEPVA